MVTLDGDKLEREREYILLGCTCWGIVGVRGGNVRTVSSSDAVVTVTFGKVFLL